MKLQGNVRGSVYPVEQRVYDEPIDGTRTCKECGHRYFASGRGNHTYCSDECRKKSLRRRNLKAAKKYQARKAYRKTIVKC